jgi:hypothetical protein
LSSPLRADSSEDDSDVLQAAENEARVCNVTKRHTTVLDRMKKCRRYIDSRLDSDSSGVEDDDEEVSDAQFREMLKLHIQRKKQRKKMRAAPEVRGANY